MTLLEHNRERAEDKASRTENKERKAFQKRNCENVEHLFQIFKVKALTEELEMVKKTINTMSITRVRSAEVEDNIQDKIREVKQRYVRSIVPAFSFFINRLRKA